MPLPHQENSAHNRESNPPRTGLPFNIRTTPIPGLLLIDLTLHGDARGWFKENWQRTRIAAHPNASATLREFRPVQNNISLNATRGTTRGLHAEPWNKYISLASGTIFGAWCDVRADSPTFGQIFSATLTPDTAVFVPAGVANGFQALSDNTLYTYLVDAHWSAQATYTNISLADPALGLQWPIPLEDPTVILSDKDRNHPPLHEVEPMSSSAPASAGSGMLILGAEGQVGKALAREFPQAARATRAECDLGWDFSRLAQSRDWSQYQVVLNAAAWTNVDGAEENPAQTWQVNALGPANLACLAQQYNFTLVHYSTDYVFPGTQERVAEQSTEFGPLNVYGQSKLAGEIAVRTAPEHLIVRTAWVVGEGKNFVRTMASLARQQRGVSVVADQYGRLSFSSDIAAGTAAALAAGLRGVIHCTNSGDSVSWFEIAREIFSYYDAAELVQPTSTTAYSAAHGGAARPAHSTLDMEALPAAGFTPADWRTQLHAYLDTLEES